MLGQCGEVRADVDYSQGVRRSGARGGDCSGDRGRGRLRRHRPGQPRPQAETAAAGLMTERPMAFTSSHLYFDDLSVGQEWESQGRTVTEADIVNFAGLSGDFNPLHVDHEFARGTPFRRPIAHGLLVMAVGSGLGLYAPPMRTLAILGIREWHFRAPV